MVLLHGVAFRFVPKLDVRTSSISVARSFRQLSGKSWQRGIEHMLAHEKLATCRAELDQRMVQEVLEVDASIRAIGVKYPGPCLRSACAYEPRTRAC